MERLRIWISTSIVGAMAVCGALGMGSADGAPSAEPVQSVQQIFSNARQAMLAGDFSETLRVSSPAVMAIWGNLAEPSRTMPMRAAFVNYFEASPDVWKVETMGAGGRIGTIVTRVQGALYYDDVETGRVTQVSSDDRAGWPWPVNWLVPGRHEAQYWHASVHTAQLAGVPVYRVTLSQPLERSPVSKIVYWFHCLSGQPMGVAFYKGGSQIFQARALIYSAGNPGPTADSLPQTTPAAPAPRAAVSLPECVGPLPRTQVVRLGQQVIGRYGRGINQIMVMVEAAQSRQSRLSWHGTQPVSGFPGYTGMTDGLWSTVRFAWGQEKVTIIGDRSEALLARWGQRAFSGQQP